MIDSPRLHHLAGDGRLSRHPAGGDAYSNAGPTRAGVRASDSPARSYRHRRRIAATPVAPVASRARPRRKLMGEHTVALNRKARHEYHIEDTFEAGIVLTGTEIKSDPRRQGQPAGGLCPDRAGRGLADRRPHRAVRRGQPLQPRAQARPQAAAPSGRDRPAPGPYQAKGLTLVPLRLYITAAAAPSSSSASRAASSSMTAGATSPSGTPGATSSASSPTSQPRSLGSLVRGPIGWPAAVSCSDRTVRATARAPWGCVVSTGPVPGEREPRCRQASLNRRQNEVTGNRQPALALAA